MCTIAEIVFNSEWKSLLKPHMTSDLQLFYLTAIPSVFDHLQVVHYIKARSKGKVSKLTQANGLKVCYILAR